MPNEFVILAFNSLRRASDEYHSQFKGCYWPPDWIPLTTSLMCFSYKGVFVHDLKKVCFNQKDQWSGLDKTWDSSCAIYLSFSKQLFMSVIGDAKIRNKQPLPSRTGRPLQVLLAQIEGLSSGDRPG